MLLRPIMRCPLRSTELYREETFTIGSPSVFHTAPPQPASKARTTCSPQFAGGPDANQNGFGQRMPPAKTVVRSAILRLQPAHNSSSCSFSFRYSVHHFPSAVYTVARGVVPRIRSAAGLSIHDHRPVANFNP